MYTVRGQAHGVVDPKRAPSRPLRDAPCCDALTAAQLAVPMGDDESPSQLP